MLIVDSEVAPRLKRGAKKESHAAQIKQWVEDQTANAVYIQDNDVSPANSERQMGRPFWPSELEARLKVLNPNLFCEVNPFNPSMKALYHLRSGEGKHFICAYHNSIMPERSIMRVKEELVQDFDFVKDGADGIPRMHLDRADLTKDHLQNTPGAVPLGMKKVLIPYGEYKRGWRTVMIKLVEAKLASPSQVERVFGADNTAAWAKHMGKRSDVQIPW